MEAVSSTKGVFSRLKPIWFVLLQSGETDREAHVVESQEPAPDRSLWNAETAICLRDLYPFAP